MLALPSITPVREGGKVERLCPCRKVLFLCSMQSRDLMMQAVDSSMQQGCMHAAVYGLRSYSELMLGSRCCSGAQTHHRQRPESCLPAARQVH